MTVATIIFSLPAPMASSQDVGRTGTSARAVRPGGDPNGLVGGDEGNTPASVALVDIPLRTPYETSAIPQLPAATDPVQLAVTKTWTGSAWQYNLAWSGGTGPFTVSYATDRTFGNGVKTLERGLASTNLAVARDATKSLEVFAVNDESSGLVSKAVEGIGYDPDPAPSMPTASLPMVWWGDQVQLSASYLDPIPEANATSFFGRLARATTTTSSGRYGTSATFTIPDDARTFYPMAQAHGRSSPLNASSFVTMSPPGVGPYTSIRGIAWAPQTGNVWVAAAGLIQQSDVFLHTPQVQPPITGLTKPYLSRVTTGGLLLYVDGVAGVTTVFKIDLTTGVVTPYASTHDDAFTRNVTPVGIAADPDGSVCFIADASTGRVVKVPANAGPGTATIRDSWGGRTLGFPDPCGIDVHSGHQVLVASNDGSIYQLTGQSTSFQDKVVGVAVRSLEIDRDSSDATARYYTTTNVGFAEATNRRAIGGDPAAYHGAFLYGLDNGRLAVDPHWGIYSRVASFQRVVLNNSGQPAAYPSSLQVADRVMRLEVVGWAGVPVRLRVIDPPDLSAYAPASGCPQGGCTPAPPYEANDNRGSADYGLSAASTGPWTTTLSLTPQPSSQWNGLGVFYLKAPAQYSGDNFQVELTKCRPDGTVLPQRVAGMSGVFTSWKRVFVERDRMFRWGGLLYASYGATAGCGAPPLPACQCGGAPPQPPCCGTGAEPPCDQIEVYDWQNAWIGDEILVFDPLHAAEGGGESRTITAVAPPNEGVRRLTLNTPLTKNYLASPSDDFTRPTFADLGSAGFGVVSACDASANQVNAAGSCFFDADMRGVEAPFGDAYVELIGLRKGMGAVPFTGASVLQAGRLDALGLFSRAWFENMIPAQALPHHEATAQNYFHLIGAANNPDDASGYSWAPSDFAYVQIGWIDARYDPFPQYVRQATAHELGHLFRVNVCDEPAHHDSNTAWCGVASPSCFSSPPGHESCLMYENKNDPNWYDLIANDINRFCCINLYGSLALGPPCGDAACLSEDGIRNHVDPE